MPSCRIARRRTLQLQEDATRPDPLGERTDAAMETLHPVMEAPDRLRKKGQHPFTLRSTLGSCPCPEQQERRKLEEEVVAAAPPCRPPPVLGLPRLGGGRRAEPPQRSWGGATTVRHQAPWTRYSLGRPPRSGPAAARPQSRSTTASPLQEGEREERTRGGHRRATAAAQKSTLDGAAARKDR